MKDQLLFQRALITGGAGFIGSHLAKLLSGKSLSVTVIDLKKPKSPLPNVEYIQGDVRTAGLVEKHLSPNTAVFHFAATVSVPVCQQNPEESYSNNFNATLTVLEAIRKFQEREGKKIPLVFASTAAMYGHEGKENIPLKEADVASWALSYYAAQKQASEQAISLYRNFHGIPSIVFRFFNVYGEGQDPTSPYSGVISRFVSLCQEGKTLPLNGGGIQTRDFISVHDIVSACEKTLHAPLEKWDSLPMNLGTGKCVKVSELAKILIGLSGKPIDVVAAPSREGDVIHSCADVSRAKEVLGFSAQIELSEGLKELLGS